MNRYPNEEEKRRVKMNHQRNKNPRLPKAYPSSASYFLEDPSQLIKMSRLRPFPFCSLLFKNVS